MGSVSATEESPFATDGTRTYFTDGSALLGCTFPDCAGTVMRYPMRPPAGQAAFSGAASMVVDEGFIYLMERARIVRVARQGSNTFEVLADDARGAGNLAAHEESIFWTESAKGRVYSCPKTGCDGTPRILVDKLDTPSWLAVDDHYVYFAEAPADETRDDLTPQGSAVISRCPVTGCASPEVLVEDGEGATGPLAVDDNFLYFLGQKCSRRGTIPTDLSEPCGYLAAVPK
jgi:hypothetical protein